MEEEIKYIQNKIEENNSVVVACSGGPDSMCLLNIITNVATVKKLKIICAHVNHKVRKKSDEEEKMVREYCKNKNIIFELLTIDEYKKIKFNEDDARKRRYVFFEELIKKYKAQYLLTAHHGDDLVETVLMRLTRGSNLNGYIGIKKESKNKGYYILRPLLTTTKEKIINYNKENKVPYENDESNNSTNYTRNRYRKEILPFLKKEEKNIHQKYLKFSEELNSYNEFVIKYIKKNKIIVDNSIIINKLEKNDMFLKRKSLELLISEIQKEDILDISDNQIREMLTLFDKNNKSIDINNNYKCINEYGKIKIIKKETKKIYNVILENNLKIDGFVFYLNKGDYEKSNYCICLLSDELKLPLRIRNRKNGDKMEIKNLGSLKKVNEIFINSKVSKDNRDKYPILVDSNDTIIWLPGLKKSKFAKDKNEKYDIIIKCEAR